MSKTIVNSNCPEFGYELLSSVPYAYNLFLKGDLKETISGFDTSCLYFFSPKHTETNCNRSWDNMKKLWDTKFPNISIHRPQLDWELFSPPPFKEYYKDKSIKFEKEVIVIFNRYNKEWNGPPINYLDLPTLDALFTMLSNEYQVIYINLTKGDKYFDGAKPMELNDDKILKKYPNVYSLYDVMGMYPELSINEIQLRIFANCTKYVSSNGGQLILSAYFGGENIIFSKKTRELDPNVNSFYKWYHKLGGAVFQHVNNYGDLLELVKQKWVLKKPLINILVRTSGRPNYFNNCVKSIYSQTYKNWNLIIGVDNKNTLSYSQPALGRDVRYDYSKLVIPSAPDSDEYGVKFPYNLYLNDLQNEVKDGYVIYLDDDDKLEDEHSLLKLINVIKTNDDFVIWRVKFPNRLVPSDKNFGGPPVMKDISGIGFSFHIKNKEIWEPYKRGDYRVAKKLYDKIPNKIFLNEIITTLQREIEDGMGKKDDKIVFNQTTNDKLLSIIIPTFNNTNFLIECLESIVTSIGDNICEILVGIDSCQKTLSLVKKNIFDQRISFYYFDKNVGPYVVKNSLSKISNSNNILFFDSDDIMDKNMVGDVIDGLNGYDCVKPVYIDFNDGDIININSKKYLGEGVFGVKKSIFNYLNGFEPWMCAADSDFMGRLYKNRYKLRYTNRINFYRRIHKNGLTSRPDTGMSSPLRSQYAKLSRNKKVAGPLKIMVTEPYSLINGVNYLYKMVYDNNTLNVVDPNYELMLKLRKESLDKVFNHKNYRVKTPVEKIEKKISSINYEKINNLLNNKVIPKPIPKVKEDNKVPENKITTNKEMVKLNFPGKKNRRSNDPTMTFFRKINK
jgi:glycosyltransferase involved in cell wall biosynthesis